MDAARVLLEREGCEILGVASTSDEALRQIEEVPPDVALVDVDLGTESGFDLAQRIQRETRLTPAKVILVSTYSKEDFADVIDFSPVAGFLSKSHLSARAIRDILDASAPPST